MKWPSVFAALLLAGCAAAQSAAPIVSGQVVDWGGQPGLTALLEINTEAGPYNLASHAQVDARGRFQLPLADDVTSLLVPTKSALNVAPGTCQDGVRLTPPNARAQQFFIAVHRGRDHLGSLQRLSSNLLPIAPGDVAARLVYADEAARLTGAVTCPSGRVERWDVTLARGWNWVQLRATPGLPGYPNFEVTSAPPNTLRWYRYGETGALNLQADEGFVVTKLSPALRERGLRAGDRLVMVDALYADELQPGNLGLLAEGAPGTPVRLTLDRQGRRIRLTVPREVVKLAWP